MLNSASDYLWVNVSGLSGFITGNVLPKRDSAGDGTWLLLKYEDYLFLLEAMYERANWDTQPSASVAPSGRALLKSAINGVRFTASNTGAFVNNSVVLPTTIVAGSSIATIANTLGLTAVQLQSVQFDRRLQARELYKSFYNVSLLSRTAKSITPQDIAGSWTSTLIRTYSDGRQVTEDTGDGWGELYEHGKAIRTGSSYDLIVISYKTSFGNFPYVTAATLLVKVTTTNSTSLTSWSDIYPVSCSVNNGDILIPSLSAIAPAACAAHGLDYSTGAGYRTSDGASVSISEMLLVCENDFPAEIDSLNWSWSPSDVLPAA